MVPQNETHTITESIILHMVPGILAGVFYFLVREPLLKIGYPSIFALTLSVAFVIVPVEMGYLLYKGKQKNGRYTLRLTAAVKRDNCIRRPFYPTGRLQVGAQSGSLATVSAVAQ